ncbi:unnamed protein product [Ranitomeya imitator]|uniref:Chromo domain-containing protein n=1 Tax=Ranitomeya imitator TaxID=111125 RepID=A0ABN9KYG0_9NEOB|nr:unnamed protein product [Ranitomeya imitator]
MMDSVPGTPSKTILSDANFIGVLQDRDLWEEIKLAYDGDVFLASPPDNVNLVFQNDRVVVLQRNLKVLKDSLTAAQKRYKKLADRFRKPAPMYKVGDLVWLSNKNLRLGVPSQKLGQKFIGTFKITGISCIVPPPPVLDDGEEQFVVQDIIDSRLHRNRLQYLVRWQGYSPENDSWEPVSNINAPLKVAQFHAQLLVLLCFYPWLWTFSAYVSYTLSLLALELNPWFTPPGEVLKKEDTCFMENLLQQILARAGEEDGAEWLRSCLAVKPILAAPEAFPPPAADLCSLPLQPTPSSVSPPRAHRGSRRRKPRTAYSPSSVTSRSSLLQPEPKRKSRLPSSRKSRSPANTFKEALMCELSPLGFHLSPSMKELIWNNHYVDLFSLLPRREQLGKMDKKDDKTEPVDTKRGSVKSFNNWIQAFAIYSAVVGEKSPHLCSKLFQHVDIILEAYQNFGGFAWLNLYEAFRQKLAVVRKKIYGELVLGLLLPPFPNFRISPLGVVPKKEAGSFRLIHHLSYPLGASLNDEVDKATCSVTYSSFDVAIDILRNFDRGVLMSKSDIKSTFRLFPVHPDGFSSLGFHFENNVFFDKCLPMGFSLSCFYFESFSSFLHWVLDSQSSDVGILHSMTSFL